MQTTNVFGFVALSNLCTRFGNPNQGAHGALQDAEMLPEVYLKYRQSQAQQGRQKSDDEGVAKTPAKRSKVEKPAKTPSPTKPDEPQSLVIDANVLQKTKGELWL